MIVFHCFLGPTLVKMKVAKDSHSFFIHITDPKKTQIEREAQEMSNPLGGQQNEPGQWVTRTAVKNYESELFQ